MSLVTRGWRPTRLLRAVMHGHDRHCRLPAEMTSAIYKPTDPFVIPPVGKVYDHLSVAWWKYALEQPNSENPLLDADGQTLSARPGGTCVLPGWHGRYRPGDPR